MNRFTKDMAIIDDMLPLLMFDLIQVGSHMNLYCRRWVKGTELN